MHYTRENTEIIIRVNQGFQAKTFLDPATTEGSNSSQGNHGALDNWASKDLMFLGQVALESCIDIQQACNRLNRFIGLQVV